MMVVLGLPVLIGLGIWQLDRAEQKGELEAAFERMAAASPIPLDVERYDEPPTQYRRVAVSGEYLAGKDLLHDNRTHKGRVGYHLLTPLRIAGDTAVLVNRGWVPAGPTRDVLPSVATPSGRMEVRGMVYRPSDRQILLGPEEPHGGTWPRVVQRIDFVDLENQLGIKLLPYTIRLSEQEPNGFVRDWRPHYGAGPNRHKAYAIQWFSFALIFLGVYVAHGLKRDKPQSDTPAAEGGGR
jgi:surfeit locus 1 family protein